MSSSNSALPSPKVKHLSDDESLAIDTVSPDHSPSIADSQISDIIKELKELQDEVAVLHSSLKESNEQIRRDIQDFCSIGQNDISPSDGTSSFHEFQTL
ncbi:LAQU0S13e02630g1_1 [Lachancea quebecensis]|uniref:LAQU0S13e02630g1_1 n=1 Tax=Lachancea quebecensis TaxID=1654605 RepID=A0A0P1KVB6_9SACH|nr:LAQU0S13e02630g1_1 [Lachancea quebecensis]